MSIIPKINISTPFNKKSRDRMNFDCQTTGNIGSVQPTLCREMVPDETFHVSNKTLVRLASMPVPTFGRLSQRDYYTFVRMSDLYEPWANFLSGQPFTPSSGSAFTPSSLPYFSATSLVTFLVEYSYSWFLTGDLKSIVIDRTTQFANLQSLFKRSIFSDFVFHPQGSSESLYFNSPNIDDPFSKGGFIYSVEDTNVGELVVGCTQVDSDGNITSSLVFSDKFPSPSYEGADYILYLAPSNFTGFSAFTTAAGVTVDPATDGLYLCFKLKPIAKHLRQIFIGCGYQFNPWENPSIKFNPYKLFGFYKSWFDLMRPVRDIQFTNTNCYRCMKVAESSNNYNFSNLAAFDNFLLDLAFDTYFYTQPDYFSMAIPSVGDTTINNSENMIVLDGRYADTQLSRRSNSLGSTVSSNANNFAMANSALVIQGMMKLLRFTSKNNIIGRSIREYAKVHFGIDDLQQQNHEVTRIGVSRVDIAFDEVMSNAETAEGSLGEYAGKGIGFKESDKFDFTARDFGYIFCLSVLVPESGYYQGYLAENTHLDRYQFFMPEFDALGYQVLQTGEVKSDFEISSPNLDPSQYSGNYGFGFVPRYSEYKVSRNIINGDLTLRSSRSGLEGYYLDKRFPSYKETTDVQGNIVIKVPDFIPNSSNLGFRKIDPTDNVGNYNRIFNYTYIDADHFIIQKVFYVEVTAPWKSLSNSFDTIQEGEKVVERNHQ